MINIELFGLLLGGVISACFFFCVVWFIFNGLIRIVGGGARRAGHGRPLDRPSGWRRGAVDGDAAVGRRICPRRRCSKVNEPDARFCARCGRRL